MNLATVRGSWSICLETMQKVFEIALWNLHHNSGVGQRIHPEKWHPLMSWCSMSIDVMLKFEGSKVVILSLHMQAIVLYWFLWVINRYHHKVKLHWLHWVLISTIAILMFPKAMEDLQYFVYELFIDRGAALWLTEIVYKLFGDVRCMTLNICGFRNGTIGTLFFAFLYCI